MRLLAWRLDLAHVDPLSTVSYVSGGNPKYPAGTPVDAAGDLRAPRHRATRPARGRALRAAPAIAARRRADRPAEALRAGRGRRLRRARPLHGARSPVGCPGGDGRDADGNGRRAGHGDGPAIDWTWDSTGDPGRQVHWTIDAGPTSAGDRRRRRHAPRSLPPRCAKPAVFSPNGDGHADRRPSATRLARRRSLVTGDARSTRRDGVATLVASAKTAGSHDARWDADGVSPTGPTASCSTRAGRDGTETTATRRRDRRPHAAGLVSRARLLADGDGGCDTFALQLHARHAAGVTSRSAAGGSIGQRLLGPAAGRGSADRVDGRLPAAGRGARRSAGCASRLAVTTIVTRSRHVRIRPRRAAARGSFRALGEALSERACAT